MDSTKEDPSMKRIVFPIVSFAVLLFFSCSSLFSQNVFLVVIDGARYTETFGAQERYIPQLWNSLRKQGTLYTHFYNNGTTETNSGFSSLVTGTWQHLVNDGSEFPDKPTIFEYFRKHTNAPESTCFVISGKKKLHVLTSSRAADYGTPYRAAFLTADSYDDIETWDQVVEVVQHKHPRLVVICFPEVDFEGHVGRWRGYLRALRQVDSLIALLWSRLQSDPFYKNSTTLLVTNDHGRHTDDTKEFRNHGDSCEGCRHIMLLALGPNFTPNTVVVDTAYQIDIAPTIGAIMSFPTPYATGRNLLKKRTVIDH